MMMNEFVSFPSLLSITENFSFHTCPIRIFMSPRISLVCPVDWDFGRLKVRLFDQTSKNFYVSVNGSVKGIQKVLGPVSLCWPVFKDPCSSPSSFLTSSLVICDQRLRTASPCLCPPTQLPIRGREDQISSLVYESGQEMWGLLCEPTGHSPKLMGWSIPNLNHRQQGPREESLLSLYKSRYWMVLDL